MAKQKGLVTVPGKVKKLFKAFLNELLTELLNGIFYEPLDKLQAYCRDNKKKVLAIIIALVVFGYGMRQLTLVPALCSNCHETYPFFKSWQQSIHSTVPCDACHKPPGIVKGMNRAYLEFTAPNKPDSRLEARVIGKTLPNEVCEQCHSMNRTFTFGGGLIVPHEKHLEQGVRCTTCHSNIAHAEGGEKAERPKMETCMQCHNGKKAPENCGVCHITTVDPSSDYYNPY
ncbi:MAG: hypothetical protein COW32_00455 [Candidatus Aquicultor secundus]|uniref:Cytochrome c7-like domain-containing protein n=1 Tax=Candidatus Aquicultor secundus TaxID=1973895 RepID=A0A2M7T5N0_9ACTN|nr:cytochrome c3 family protein [Candidatus Aquicultor secundus]NCO66117.1 hypothetical protein [Solirubrobacter sp.]OIO84996.1 MAG: hypothetical protein AUK32_07820 [Candidatus Aquicultor secundus]PIU28046.1 MAG: hypothetical protein COT10_00240 [Candidatus Aquicultor secundus]PIW23206.1 MAG: hypothetical protein COW32_00455 [Candidatus Aquicultor secundus]PIX51332.1 MAG: hypothetical protein COZ51_10275 [Candidatus Aquicultor secundus]